MPLSTVTPTGAAPALRLASALALAALILAPSPARAGAPAPASAPASAPSPTPAGKTLRDAAKKLLLGFEDELVRRAMAHFGVEPDLAPEGKTIARILFFREDVLRKGDYYFNFISDFNVFHTTTRESTIRRELLFEEGGRYQKSDVEDSERRLRNLIIFSTVRFVPIKVDEPGKVGVLVVTKDLWSLRTNFYVVYNAGTLEYIETNPSENNLAGRYKILTGHLQMDLGKFSVGEGYYDPRVFGSRATLIEDFWLELSRETGKPEGVRARAALFKPLFSLRDEYSWVFDVALDHGVERFFRGNSYQVYTTDDYDLGSILEAPPPLPWFVSPTPEDLVRSAVTRPWAARFFPPGRDANLIRARRRDLGIPLVYNRTVLVAYGAIVRSFGYDVKHEFRLQAGYVLDTSKPPAMFPTADGILRSFPPALLESFVANVLPVEEQYLYTLVRYSTSRSRFAKIPNINALGITEDFRLGHTLLAEMLFGASLDGSPDFIQGLLQASYRFQIRDDYLYFGVAVRSRLLARPGTEFEGELPELVNNSGDLEVRNTFPYFLGGRFHARVVLGVRDRDLNRERFCVGGGYPNPSPPLIGHGDLRGFVTNRFCGTHRLLANVEWRSLPLNLSSFQLGLAVFSDFAMVTGGGDRFIGTSPFAASVGVGLRTQFPQLDREAFRIDLAFPVVGRVPGFDAPLVLTLVFLQVF